MKISISEARRRFPALIKIIQKDPRTSFQITVRNEIVAKLQAAPSHPRPGEAARKLLQLRKRLAHGSFKAEWSDISSSVNKHLYGSGGVVR